ncbi:hypothetical protein JHN63_24595 [Streptomyces sp. MBT65]|uniref:hypothetical protein n=1 Tax=Streptomyces sp. MBT65 TaxID=1488395 RepID=UPI00190B126C|nr:hypothetical protein [Streptomyces sp. MBT65]MBK3576922.1 hypothetical protein [Streptomyces sp. MBT65]
MDVLSPYLELCGFLAAALGFFTWFAGRVQCRGTADGGMSGALAAYEEASPNGRRRWRGRV